MQNFPHNFKNTLIRRSWVRAATSYYSFDLGAQKNWTVIPYPQGPNSSTIVAQLHRNTEPELLAAEAQK